MQDQHELKVSVLVASHNRGDRLPIFFKKFAQMADSTQTQWELILVDNGSTDETRTVVSEFVQVENLPLTYLYEPRPGKSNALNAGIENASGNIIALTDDDCYVSNNWVDAIAGEFIQNPRLGGLGGRVELFDPSACPIATRTERDRRKLLGVGRLFNLVIGCNMAFRSAVLGEIGKFDALFGPGSPIPAAEDIDIVYRAFKAGYLIEYTPEVVVHHNHGRRNEKDVRIVNRNYVIGRGAFYGKHITSCDKSILKLAVREIGSSAWQLLRGLIRWENWRIVQERMFDLLKGIRLYRRLSRTGKRD